MNWQAKWIWCGGEASPKNFYLYLRKTVQVGKQIKSAIVYVTADSRYKLYLNGQYLGRGPARCDPRWQSYDTYDVTAYLRQGKNLFAALVHHYGTGTFSYIPGRGGFLFQAQIEYGDGITEVVKSDPSWRVLPAKAWGFVESGSWQPRVPKASLQLGFQEVYDARQEIPDWNQVEFDDSGWREAVVIELPQFIPWRSLIPREIPPLREERILAQTLIEAGVIPEKKYPDKMHKIAEAMAEEQHQPDEEVIENPQTMFRDDETCAVIHPPKAGQAVYLTLDFGREVCGFPRLEVEGPAGCTLDIGYGERLLGGRIMPISDINPDSEYATNLRYTDRYVLREGRQVWENSFGLRGFRYMQITVHNLQGPLKLYRMGLNFCTYPVEQRGAFHCSDPLLNRIWEVGCRTLQLCMHDGYEDCPWREQAQWCGDAHVEARINYYAFGDARLTAQWLRHMAQSQRADGLTRSLFPAFVDWANPDYSLLWVISIWDYYLWTGDEALPRELYPNVVKLIDWCERMVDSDGLIFMPSDLPEQGFIDWADVAKRGRVTALNCFYCGALEVASRLAVLRGDKEGEEKFRQIRKRVAEAVNRHLWSEEKGAYLDCGEGKRISQHANFTALYYGVCPPERRRQVVSYVFDPKNKATQAQFYFLHFGLTPLFETDPKSALDLIRTRWGEMLAQGATTFWETRTSGVGEHLESLCHGWSATPIYHLSAEVLGVKPTEPGFKKFSVSPKPGDLKWAKGRVPTPKGEIEVSWQRDEAKFKLELRVPEGCQAEVTLPELGFARPVLFIDGRAEPLGEVILREGTHIIQLEAGR